MKRERKGIALVWAVLVLFVMLGIVGLSLDWGKLSLNVHQLQIAADAAALAGAQVVKFDQDRADREDAKITGNTRLSINCDGRFYVKAFRSMPVE